MKTKNLILLAIFLISIGFNVYSVASGEEEVSPCDNSRRYGVETAGGGIEVVTADVKSMVEAYQASHREDKTEYKTTGFRMSKKVCDEIFKNGTLNSLAFDLIVNDGQLNLSVRGTRSTQTEIDTKAGSNHFVLQSFCPSDCSAW